MILGHPWSVLFNPIIKWTTGTMVFGPTGTSTSCHEIDIASSGLARHPKEPFIVEPSTTQASDDATAQVSAYMDEVDEANFCSNIENEAYMEVYSVRVKTSPNKRTVLL